MASTPTAHRPKPSPAPDLARLILNLDSDHPRFWLAVALDDAHKSATFQGLLGRCIRAKRRDEVLIDAISCAILHYNHEAYTSTRHAIDTGNLLFCWPGTRALDGLGVAA